MSRVHLQISGVREVGGWKHPCALPLGPPSPSSEQPSLPPPPPLLPSFLIRSSAQAPILSLSLSLFSLLSPLSILHTLPSIAPHATNGCSASTSGFIGRGSGRRMEC
eukprot:Sspe_Gene.37309::Locus_18009_Transcript_1_1_Confidence_1.000_Length_921::g.37309::m.37309